MGELLFHDAGEIRTIPVQIGGTSWEPEMPHTGIIMDALRDIDQINDIGIFQIPIEKLEIFKEMLILFYESGNDAEIITFMKEYCIRRVQREKAKATSAANQTQ